MLPLVVYLILENSLHWWYKLGLRMEDKGIQVKSSLWIDKEVADFMQCPQIHFRHTSIKIHLNTIIILILLEAQRR